MSLPVPGEEGDAPAVDVTEDDVVAGLPERRVDTDALGRVEEGVEPGPADDADVRSLH